MFKKFNELNSLEKGSIIVLIFFIGFILFLTTVMLTGCSSNPALPKPPTLTSSKISNSSVRESLDIIDLRNKYVKARRSWDGFLYWFSYEDVPVSSRGAVRKSISHVTDAFDHVKTILKSVKGNKYDKAAINTVEIPLVYKNARNAVLSLKSVYKRNEDKLSIDKKREYKRVYYDLVALDKKFKGKINSVDNLPEWIDLISNITDIIKSVSKH